MRDEGSQPRARYHSNILKTCDMRYNQLRLYRDLLAATPRTRTISTTALAARCSVSGRISGSIPPVPSLIQRVSRSTLSNTSSVMPTTRLMKRRWSGESPTTRAMKRHRSGEEMEQGLPSSVTTLLSPSSRSSLFGLGASKLMENISQLTEIQPDILRGMADEICSTNINYKTAYGDYQSGGWHTTILYAPDGENNDGMYILLG